MRQAKLVPYVSQLYSFKHNSSTLLQITLFEWIYINCLVQHDYRSKKL